MRRFKCIKLLILCITCLLSLNLFSNANAIDFDEAGSSNVTACSMLVVNTNVLGQASNDGGCFFMTPNANGLTKRLVLDLSTPIPGKSLVTVSGRYANDANLGFIGIPGSSTLVPLSSNTTINEGQKQLAFQYTFYTPAPLSTLTFLGELWYINSGQSRVDINTVQFATLTNEPTRAQLQQIISVLNTYNQNLSNISSDTSNIWQYLQDKEDQEEDDRDNIEQQSSTTETEANDQGDEATQTGTSLFNAFTQLLGALTNVNGNTCTLPAMQVYSLNLGNMNLCQYDIPPQIMALVSIGMVFIIIPLGINLVKRMISLYKEITG